MRQSRAVHRAAVPVTAGLVVAVVAAAGFVAVLERPAPATAQCVVRGARARLTSVRADTGDGVVVAFAVSRASVTATLPAGGAPTVSLDVQNGLAFHATATPDALELVLGAGVDTASGVVHAVAADGWRVEDARTGAGAGMVNARLRLPGLMTSAVDLPCNALRIAPVPAPPLRSALARGRVMVASAVDTLELRADATGPVTLRLETSRLAPLPLEVIARAPGQLRLRARWPGGSTLTAWAPEASVARSTGAPARESRGASSHSACGVGTRGGDRQGLATLRAAAPVYGSPDATSAWAHVAARSGFGVLLRRGARRAALLAIPGMDGQPTGWCTTPRAWVDARDVTFTGSTRRSAAP